MRGLKERIYQLKDEVGKVKHILDCIDMRQVDELIQEINQLKAEKKYLKKEIEELKEAKTNVEIMNRSKMVYPAEENDVFNKCDDLVLLNKSESVVKIKKQGLVRTFVLIKFEFDYDFDSMGV